MATQKVVALTTAGQLAEVTPNITSAGATDSGKLVALNSSGVLDSTLLPAGIGSASQTFPATEALTAGAMVNIWSSSGTPSARNANATDASKPAIGFVTAGVASAGTATVYFPGQLITGLSGLTIGAPVYLSASTAGGVTSTAPTTTGNLVQQVGYALSATSMVFQPMPGVTRG